MQPITDAAQWLKLLMAHALFDTDSTLQDFPGVQKVSIFPMV